MKAELGLLGAALPRSSLGKWLVPACKSNTSKRERRAGPFPEAARVSPPSSGMLFSRRKEGRDCGIGCKGKRRECSSLGLGEGAAGRVVAGQPLAGDAAQGGGRSPFPCQLLAGNSFREGSPVEAEKLHIIWGISWDFQRVWTHALHLGTYWLPAQTDLWPMPADCMG